MWCAACSQAVSGGTAAPHNHTPHPYTTLNTHTKQDQAGGGEGGGSDGAPSGQGVYEAVRSFCLTAGRSTVSYVDLMTAFYQVRGV